MGKKKKAKKPNLKKERYAKFRKDKSSSLTFTSPELTDEEIQQKREDERKIDYFLHRTRRVPERFVNERKARSKR